VERILPIWENTAILRRHTSQKLRRTIERDSSRAATDISENLPGFVAGNYSNPYWKIQEPFSIYKKAYIRCPLGCAIPERGAHGPA
jgi:hypothetical protein